MASHLSESQSIGVPFGSCLPESVFRAFLENAFYLGGSAPKLDCSRAGLDLQFFFLVYQFQRASARSQHEPCLKFHVCPTPRAPSSGSPQKLSVSNHGSLRSSTKFERTSMSFNKIVTFRGKSMKFGANSSFA